MSLLVWIDSSVLFGVKRLKIHGLLDALQLKEEKRSESKAADVWLREASPLKEVTRETPWALAQPVGVAFLSSNDTTAPSSSPSDTTQQTDSVLIPIVRGAEAHGKYLQVSGETFHPAADGIVQQLMGQLSGHRNVGISVKESYLPVGTTLTAIGELTAIIDDPQKFEGAIRTKDGKMYAIKAPKGSAFLLSRSTLPELIEFYRGISAFNNTVSWYFLSVGATMLIIRGFRKLWLWRQEQKYIRRIREASRRRRGEESPGTLTPTTGDRLEESEDEDQESRPNLCVICLERDSRLLYPRCGHFCVCRRCSRIGTAQTRCPICRSPASPITVYTVT